MNTSFYKHEIRSYILGIIEIKSLTIWRDTDSEKNTGSSS